MGRGKLSMDLISNERSRMLTYHKRKKGLTKKVEELHILCNVDVCAIIIGPKCNNRPVDIETWPKDRDQISQIINKYKSKASNMTVKKTQNLSDYFVLRRKKVDDEIASLRKANLDAKYPKWCNYLNLLSFEQLCTLEHDLQTKIEVAKRKLSVMKGDQDSIEGVKMENVVTHEQCLMGSDYDHGMVLPMQQISYVKPHIMQLPAMYLPDQTLQCQMFPFNANPIDNSMLMASMNGKDFDQFGGLIGNNIPYFGYYDPTASMVENMMVNNVHTGTCPLDYYGPSLQPMLPYMKGPLMVPQLTESHDFDGTRGAPKKEKLRP